MARYYLVDLYRYMVIEVGNDLDEINCAYPGLIEMLKDKGFGYVTNNSFCVFDKDHPDFNTIHNGYVVLIKEYILNEFINNLD